MAQERGELGHDNGEGERYHDAARESLRGSDHDHLAQGLRKRAGGSQSRRTGRCCTANKHAARTRSRASRSRDHDDLGDEIQLVVIQPPSSMPAPMPPWISRPETRQPPGYSEWRERHHLVEPITATWQVLNDTSVPPRRCANPGAAPGGGVSGTIGRTGARVNAVDMRGPFNAPRRMPSRNPQSSSGRRAGCRWTLRPTFPGAACRSGDRASPDESCTGMRCTILVKFPVALSGGSKLWNSSLLAGAMTLD